MSVLKKWIRFCIGIIVGVIATLSYQEISSEKERSSFPIIEREGYTLAYDTRGKIPLWTCEHLTLESLSKNADRTGIQFYEDEEIYKPHRSLLKDYAKSGFDRGHIVPAGDVRYSETALRETFSLSNICPQHSKFNRGIWKKLEEHVRSLVKEGEVLEVISGPLFLSHEGEDGKRLISYQVIGESEIAVPTHFFKVIQNGNESWSYVIPNEPSSEELDHYQFPIEKLEKISGIRFNIEASH